MRPTTTIAAALLVAALALAAPGASSPAGGERGATEAAALIDRFLARPASAHQYRAVRRLDATGGGQRGWLEAETDFTPESGLHYRVTAEGGSGYIRSRVLRSLLDEEQRLIARGGSAEVAISTDNYAFSSEGMSPEGLAVVALEPLRRERALVVGRMLLTAPGGDLVRVEGRLARSPSFWLTRVTIVRTYRRLNGALVPESLHSTGHLRWMGRSTLRMTYRYLEVDHRPVVELADLTQRRAGPPIVSLTDF